MRNLVFIFFIALSAGAGDATQDTPFHLEKLIFHSSVCYGACPEYHLEIDSAGEAKLHSAVVFKSHSYETADSSRIGYFTGKISPETLDTLVSEIRKCGLDTLTYDHDLCCDAPVITIIAYHNGKRDYFKAMWYPEIMGNVISRFYRICENNNFQRTKKPFIIER